MLNQYAMITRYIAANIHHNNIHHNTPYYAKPICHDHEVYCC